MVKIYLAVVLQLLGLIAVAIGAFLLVTWLGFVVTGLALFGVGLLMERVVPIKEDSIAGAEQR